jgi:hypothetical protein
MSHLCLRTGDRFSVVEYPLLRLTVCVHVPCVEARLIVAGGCGDVDAEKTRQDLAQRAMAGVEHSGYYMCGCDFEDVEDYHSEVLGVWRTDGMAQFHVNLRTNHVWDGQQSRPWRRKCQYRQGLRRNARA